MSMLKYFCSSKDGQIWWLDFANYSIFDKGVTMFTKNDAYEVMGVFFTAIAGMLSVASAAILIGAGSSTQAYALFTASFAGLILGAVMIIAATSNARSSSR